MDNDLSGEWVGSIDETDETALQWFAINLMTHNLQNKGLVSGTAVIVSVYDKTRLIDRESKIIFFTKTVKLYKLYFFYVLTKIGRCRRRGSKYYICN